MVILPSFVTVHICYGCFAAVRQDVSEKLGKKFYPALIASHVSGTCFSARFT
jgi:hypothetical protein